MTPYEMALTERLAHYVGWLAVAVTCHPLVSLRTRAKITKGAKWTLVLAGVLTSTSLWLGGTIEVPLHEPYALHGEATQHAVARSRALMPALSWLWGCSLWLGLLALCVTDDSLRRRRVALSALGVAVICGLAVSGMRVGIAVGTQVPW